jgi:hypothetical protein
MQASRPKIRFPGLPDSEAFTDPVLADRAYAALRKTLQETRGRKDLRPRVGADLVLELLQDDGTYKRYELLANGTRVRDPESREVWKHAEGRKLVMDAVPRLFAAARKRTQERSRGR